MVTAKVWGLSFTGGLLLLATGCVGPMACAPTGCDSRGPLAFHRGGGCGDCQSCDELYIDPWVNHRADICDPCDGCGNYNGQSCGKCGPIFSGYRSLWGYRMDPPPRAGHCEPACGIESCGGCDSCGGVSLPPSSHHHGMPRSIESYHGVPTPAPEIIWEGDEVEVVPAPNPAESGPAASESAYRPQRTRQIFRSRGGVAVNAPRPRGH